MNILQVVSKMRSKTKFSWGLSPQSRLLRRGATAYGTDWPIETKVMNKRNVVGYDPGDGSWVYKDYENSIVWKTHSGRL